MRMDKWLWAARFFKTRALAARACELGRVQIADQPAAPGLELPQRHGARSQGQNREIRNGGSLPGS
ncbi:MAG: S4 domain-containing protein, partial [Terriglobales bacterium]